MMTVPSTTRRAALAALTVIAVLTGSACAGSTGAPGPAPSLVTPSSATSAPLSAAEQAWVDGVRSLHQAMDATPSVLTSDTMRSFAETVAGCTRQLDTLGAYTERLRPVRDLADEGCGQYQKAAECLVAASAYGTVFAGSEEERRQSESVQCAITAMGEGSRLFAEAEVKAFTIGQGTTR
jgi:hypothetical protein